MSWFLLLPCWFVFNLLAYLVAPILPLFKVQRVGDLDNSNANGPGWRLPEWLKWFDTFDNALTGDAGFRETHDDSYWSMVQWLWRNPAVGFERYVLSAKLVPSVIQMNVYGDTAVQDGPVGKEGYCFTQIQGYWNLVYIKRFGSRCLKLDLGWQLKTFAEGHPLTPIARYAMSVRLPTFKS